MKKILTLTLTLTLSLTALLAQTSVREQRCMDADWQFAFGDASSPAKDFGCGTEYFNYLTKANSIHSEGPYSFKFDAKKWNKEWKTVSLPHDWAVDLPFAREASHSHGYKTVGHKYPETSIGWYRKTFTLKPSDEGKHCELQFDGIFRNAQIWVNGFYLGGEQSGYISRAYDITDYLQFSTPSNSPTGGEQIHSDGSSLPPVGESEGVNLICVRVDASLEEGWFYEGAGIYRHVWMNISEPLHFKTFSHAISFDNKESQLSVKFGVENDDHDGMLCNYKLKLIDAKGNIVKETNGGSVRGKMLDPKADFNPTAIMPLNDVNIHLWSPEDPYLYIVRTELYSGNKLCDVVDTKYGFRTVEFDKDKGMTINGKPFKIHGACMHQDNAGVGAAMPDDMNIYRMKTLKKFGFNAIRTSHNPVSTELLNVCDSLGIIVIEENRLFGVNDYQIGQLKAMIDRDRNHPSIIAWSVGNEEWGVEWEERGTKIVATMTDYVHKFDPTRPSTAATSGGPTPVVSADVAGYNYVRQNPIDEHRKNYPQRIAYGSEETSGCGTRGVYFNEIGGAEMPDYAKDQYDEFMKRNPSGRMPAFNRCADNDSVKNRIERGWKFYDERPWLLGCFYWTGFDYRGESNPLVFPATNSEFGIFDYCGFPKDEAYYLKSWWTNEPVLHLLPHWNLEGHEGEEIDVWAYSNCDEVELFVNGKSAGKQKMEKNGHLSWKVKYQPGTLKAVGYKNGKKTLTETIATTGKAEKITLKKDRYGEITVVTVEMRDKKNRIVPTACCPIYINVSGDAKIIGVGNGDSAWNDAERPTDANAQQFSMKTFNGLAMVILKTPSDDYNIDVKM